MRFLAALLPAKPFTRQQLRLVGLLWVTGILIGFSLAQAVNTLPFSRQTFGLTEGQMGFVLGAARLGAIGALAFSAYGDRRGRRGPFLAALGLLFAASGLTAISQTPLQFAMLQSVSRMGATAASVLATVLLAEELDRSNRAYGIGLFAGGGSFGAGIALVVLPVAELGADSWRVLFAASAVGLLFLPLLATRVNESSMFNQRASDATVFTALRHPVFWLLGGVLFLAASFTAVVAAFSTERLISDLGFSAGLTAAILLIGGTAGGIGFLTGGRLADAWGRRPAASFALSLALIGGLGLYHLQQAALLTLAAGVGAYGAFSAAAPLGAQRTELFGTDVRSTAGVWLNNVAVAGAATGLALGPVTIDLFGLSQTVTVLGAGMLVAAFGVMLLPETRGKSIDITPVPS